MEDENKKESECCKNEKDTECCKKGDWHKNAAGGSAGTCGAVYFMTVIGAAVFYIQHAATFWLGVLGFLKALVWPAMMIYKIMEKLGM